MCYSTIVVIVKCEVDLRESTFFMRRPQSGIRARRPGPAPTGRDAPDPVREHLSGIDPDALSPREAHAALYALKALLKAQT